MEESASPGPRFQSGPTISRELIVLGILHLAAHLLPTAAPCYNNFSKLHFTDGEAEALGGYITCLSDNWYTASECKAGIYLRSA